MNRLWARFEAWRLDRAIRKAAGPDTIFSTYWGTEPAKQAALHRREVVKTLLLDAVAAERWGETETRKTELLQIDADLKEIAAARRFPSPRRADVAWS